MGKEISEYDQCNTLKKFDRRVNTNKQCFRHPVHPYGTVCIGILALLILLCCCGCLLRMCWKRRKVGKDARKGLKGTVDLKSVQLLGSSMKEKVDHQQIKVSHSFLRIEVDVLLQVQPDLESLEGNMEDNEGVENAKEEVKLGKLQFSMDYDFQKSEVNNHFKGTDAVEWNNASIIFCSKLSVGVIQAVDLPGMDMSGTSDPYVKVYILPDKKKKFETKVHRKTLNPVFNETFVFKASWFFGIMRVIVVNK